MAAYSLDLRKRIVDAVERGDASKREIARMFGVHETFFHKLLRQKRERGDIAPLPHGGGAEAILKEDHLMILTGLLAESPDATLEELREQMKKRRVSRRASRRSGAPWTSSSYLVKKSKRDDKADPVERAMFAKKQMVMPVERLIFIDEFAINTARRC